ncbi:ABC transporter permease subunit [Allobranchiibius huperziae]|uniref:Simple sugar transport system permease protein n=1 Tax=Allobranchiibius huperziae TaxID=1874116 RepID=A0A853DFA7_9MICO|nr:simple sugar transport system permease protein [Allobranchiibius huperziae]
MSEQKAGGEPAVSTPESGSSKVDQTPDGGAGRLREIFRSDHPAILTILAIFAAVVIGSILIIASDQATRTAAGYFTAAPMDTISAAWHAVSGAYVAIFEGSILNPSSLSSGNATTIFGPISETIVSATPLIFAGLSVTLAFRAGLFNIGAQGQILLAAIFAGYVGFSWHLPVVLHVIVAVLAGILGGALWAGLAGVLKAKTGAHEVITTIMLNYVALGLIQYLLGVHGFQAKPYNQAISPAVDHNAMYPHLLGSALRANVAFLVAIAATVAVAWLLNRSTFGFRLRTVGANQDAARTAGISISSVYIVVMLIVGALAGLAGSAQVLGTSPQVTSDIDAGVGFDAITVSLLGRGSPIGTFWAGMLFGALRAGSVQLLASTNTPSDLVQVLQALIVLFIAAPGLVRLIFRLRRSGGGQTAVVAKGWNG